MMFLILSLFLSLKKDSLFRGNCTTHSAYRNSYFMGNKTKFVIILEPEKTIYNNTYSCNFEFYTLSPIEIEERFDLYGFNFNGNEYFFYHDHVHKNMNKSIEYIHSLTKDNVSVNIPELETFVIQNNLALPIIIYFKLGQRDPYPQKFITDRNITGHFNLHNTTYLTLTGNEIDKIKYIGEGRSFGVILSIYVALNYYAWHILSLRFNSRSLLSHFSEHSLLMHIGFDFCLLFFSLDMSMSSDHFLRIFLFLFIIMILVFFQKQMEVLAKVWRANQEDFDNENLNDPTNERIREIKLRLLLFFIEMSFIIILSSILTTLCFVVPLISIVYLYLTFLPQIFHLAKVNPRIIKSDLFFTTVIYTIRLLPLIYFLLYPRNFLLSYSIPLGLLVIVLWTLQYVILVLQNCYGGDFFLPQSYREEVYDYSATRDTNPEHNQCPICMCTINQNDQTMTPPCGHTFHRRCLTRWMEEELICPVCRAPLPIEARQPERATYN